MKRYLTTGLIFALMGFTLVLQVRTLTQKEVLAMRQSQSTDEMVTQLIKVSKERDRLQEELRVLKDMATQAANRSRLQEQMLQERGASGLAPVEGRGVVVTLGDSRSVDRILVKDVLLVLNELRASGAEAMAIGDVRVTERTRIGEAASGIVEIDGETIDDQVVISAVGDPQVLVAGLNMRGGILEELINYYPVSLMEAPQLVVPPIADEQTNTYARPDR
ncbi:MAG TPA: DUF881 domain-containing protein [Symbiobacteriaceae bacterium]|nr:DUF881 domain-containing protein [Symbiobacteriaceae bacterium]